MYSHDDLDEIQLQFQAHGFVHLRQVLPPAFLARLHAAFDRAAAANGAGPTGAAAATRGFFDIPAVLDQDDAFVDLADLPSLFPVLVALVGDDLQLTQTAARLFYPGKTFTAPFHSDLSHVTGFSHEHSLNFLTKVHFYLEDLSPDQGCLAFIPGSHRLPAGHPRPQRLLNEQNNAAVKIVPKAGDVVIFNTHVMHMALDNASTRVRKSIIYAYSHFWMKQYASAIPADLSRFTCRQRKQLFGVDDPNTPHFNRRLIDDQPGLLNRAAASAGRFARKLIRA